MPNGGVQPVGDAAVVGVGDEGRWIALSLALGGFRVVVVGSSHGDLRGALDDVRNALGNLEQQGTVDRWTAELARQHLVPSTSVSGAMGEVGFAVEAVADDLELKRRVLAELDRHCPPRAVLASASSCFSVSRTGHLDQPARQGCGDQVGQPRPSDGPCRDRSRPGNFRENYRLDQERAGIYRQAARSGYGMRRTGGLGRVHTT